MMWNTTVKHKSKLILILLLAFGLRIYGLNWDQNNHLHPDERFLTMVAGAMKWPTTIAEYFDTANSKLNPHNIGFGFYVYGTYPVIFIKFISFVFGFDNYNNLVLVGRFLSAVLDTGTVFLVYLVAKKIFEKEEIALWSAFVYSIMVLPIQLAHFFTVDPYATFFSLLAFYFVLKNKVFNSGLSMALAISAKVSGIFFLPILVVPLFFDRKNILRKILLFGLGLTFGIVVFYPYLFDGFGLNNKILQNWRELKLLENRKSWFPPGVQWINTKPIIYPLKHLVIYGMGIVLFIYSLWGWFFAFKKHFSWKLVFISLWLVSFFIYQGSQFAKPVRYFYILYPFLAMFCGIFIHTQKHRIFLIILALIWPLAFVSIYTTPHSRVQASEWILQNIPFGSVLSCEHWDDCLPLNNSGNYKQIELPMFAPDDSKKWTEISLKLKTLDYLILTSNRVYGSTMTVPERYPITAKFYQDLFLNKLDFIKIAEFTSRPKLPGIEFVDDYADEVFTVYDHPKVTIFKKK